MPDDLLNTRWMFIRYERVLVEDHVEVIAVQGDNAILVTCYSTPLRSWIVPIASLQAQPGAFTPLGQARDFWWVSVETYVTFVGVENIRPTVDTHELIASHATGTWDIGQLTHRGVVFARRPYLSNGHVMARQHFIPWTHFLRLYRPATRTERHDYIHNQSRFHLVEIRAEPEAVAEQVTVDLDASRIAGEIIALNQQAAAEVISAINSPPEETPLPEPRRPRWDRLNEDEDDT